jgi:hypothetical protein
MYTYIHTCVCIYIHIPIYVGYACNLHAHIHTFTHQALVDLLCTNFEICLYIVQNFFTYSADFSLRVCTIYACIHTYIYTNTHTYEQRSCRDEARAPRRLPRSSVESNGEMLEAKFGGQTDLRQREIGLTGRVCCWDRSAGPKGAWRAELVCGVPGASGWLCAAAVWPQVCVPRGRWRHGCPRHLPGLSRPGSHLPEDILACMYVYLKVKVWIVDMSTCVHAVCGVHGASGHKCVCHEDADVMVAQGICPVSRAQVHTCQRIF